MAGAGGASGRASVRLARATAHPDLRLDVDRTSGGRPYAIPPDNPFVGQPGTRPEIWALGLRNPWRFGFDRTTGALWIGDVGQVQWEEVDVGPAGQGGRNYGWDVMEGRHCYAGSASHPDPGCAVPDLVRPAHEYGHDLGCSVTGGYVYRGRALPALVGGYVFADFCAGNVWRLRRDAATGRWVRSTLVPSDLRISSFGEDDRGELYLTDLAGGGLYRLAAA